MNKKILLCALPLSFLVGACSQPGLVKVEGCVVRHTPKNCVDNSGAGKNPFVNVTPRGWVVTPLNVCVKAGDELEIRFKGNPKSNTLGTIPKGNTDIWLVGRNSNEKGQIVLKVPPGPSKGTSFDYTILSTTEGCVDPRVTYG
jgi:hypothetical protein